LKGQIPFKTWQRPPAGGMSAFQTLRGAAADTVKVSPFAKVKPFSIKEDKSGNVIRLPKSR